METQTASWRDEHPTVEYVAPFVIFIIFLAASAQVPLDTAWGAPLKAICLAAVCVAFWPRELAVRPVKPLASVGIGALVFLLWIAPDVLIPHYRDSVFFSNPILGHVHSSLSAQSLHDPWTLLWRTARAVLIVPVVEELFWRAWLMRWLVNSDFRRVALGTYAPFAFWITAILFASEHGPYWDVGLVTGVIYNWWMIRTRSVADCILMHAVTNGLLSAYVIYAGQWQYWQ